MRNLRLINAFDFGRALGDDPRRATPETVASWLVTEIAQKSGGNFTYDAAGDASVDIIRGRQSLEGAEAYCRARAQPAGRDQNVHAIRAAFPYLSALNCDATPLTPVAIPYAMVEGRELYIGVKVPVFARKPRAPTLVMPQYRRSFAPSVAQLAPPMALVARARELGAYDAGDPVLVWAHPLDGTQQRGLRVLRRSDLPACSDAQLDKYVAVFADGVRLALAENLAWSEGSLRGFRIFDPDQPDLF